MRLEADGPQPSEASLQRRHALGRYQREYRGYGYEVTQLASAPTAHGGVCFQAQPLACCRRPTAYAAIGARRPGQLFSRESYRSLCTSSPGIASPPGRCYYGM